MNVETVCVCENNCANCEKYEKKSENIEARTYRRCFENEIQNQNENKYTDVSTFERRFQNNVYTYTDGSTFERRFQNNKQVYADIPTSGCFQENENKKNINENEIFATDEYKRIMHNINNEGIYTDCIFNETHDDYTMPNIFTPEEDDEIMREFNSLGAIPGGDRVKKGVLF